MLGLDPGEGVIKGFRAAIRRMNSTIRGKLTLLAIAAVGAFLLVSVGESLAVRSILREVERRSIDRRVYRARATFQRLAENKANLVSEFSFWDDTWRAEDDPDTPWARRFIKENFVGWLPNRYGDQIIEIWSRSRTPVLRWSDSSVAELAPYIDHSQLFAIADRQKLAAGYVATPRGVLLVASSLVLRSTDSRLTGPSNGYVIAGQMIDSAAIARISDELQDNFQIRGVLPAWPPDSIMIEPTASGDTIVTTFALRGLNDAPVAMVVMSSSREFTRKLASLAYVVLILTVLIGIVVLSLLWRAGNRMVIRPLGEIALALEQMQHRGQLAPLDTSQPTHEWGTFIRAFNGTVAAWQSSEKRYQVLFDQAADAYLLLEGDTQRILTANPAAEALAGLSCEEMIGQSFGAILPLETSIENHGTFRLRRRDGSLLTVSMVCADLEIDGARRKLASLRDLTQHEILSAQLRQSQKMEVVGSLAGGIAHDFNNLLGAVLMATSSLRIETEGNQLVQESIETIEQASHRAAELTRRLLSFARREHQRSVPVSLADVVSNVVRLCERTFDRAIRIHVAVAPELAAISGDPGQLEQALLNLCINARDAMPSGGVLRISVEARILPGDSAQALTGASERRFVVVTIADTGLGLTAQAEKHLFEPFFTTKGQGKGTGLGLAMVYGIVKNHGGTIQVRNLPGRGVTFELHLPAGDTAFPFPVHPLVRVPPRGTEHLLVIDDEAALRSVVARTLTRLGYTVDSAENGVRGVERFASDPFAVDLVLLDVVMPEMGGAETFRRLREIRPDLPVLVCSGYSADAERKELLDSGAAGFLEKPFDTIDLARAVREVLDKLPGKKQSP